MPLEHFEGGEGEGNLQTVMINDGTRAWIISPFGERKELSEEEANSTSLPVIAGIFSGKRPPDGHGNRGRSRLSHRDLGGRRRIDAVVA